jgi:hypothetical protein
VYRLLCFGWLAHLVFEVKISKAGIEIEIVKKEHC